MPSVIYVAIGLPGFIRCPVDANPPVTLVKWKKDGLPLRIEKVSWCGAAALVPLALARLRLQTSASFLQLKLRVIPFFTSWFRFRYASLSLVWVKTFSCPELLTGRVGYYWSIIIHHSSLHTVHDFSIHSILVGAKWTMGASVWQRWRRTLSAPIPACLTTPWVPWDGPLPLPWC